MSQDKHTAQFSNLFWATPFFTYFTYGLLILLGLFRDFLARIFWSRSMSLIPTKAEKGMAPLLRSYENFFRRRLYRRIEDCWNRPLCSPPGAWIEVIDRVRKPTQMTVSIPEPRTSTRALNLGSYNYLGFAGPESTCIPSVLETLDTYGVSTMSFRPDAGTSKIHMDLEKLVAEFLGKPDCLIYGQGFATNSTTIPSIVGAYVKTFHHGDLDDLEKVIRSCIVYGQPKTRRPYTKILIMVEGIYSMEGEICELAEIVELKKKYKCYLYLDEAHSIGCMGRTGRGICEYRNVSTDDVDILMGTFTKSFAGVGGYIASSTEIVNYLRITCSGYLYSSCISPPACQQVTSALKVIMGQDGTNIGRDKLRKLNENSNFFRKGLIDIGCRVLGDWNSPVIPIMLYNPTKIGLFSRDCLEKNIATVVVGFPATPLLLSRARFCMSSSHSIEDLQNILKELVEVCRKVHVRYNNYIMG